MVTLNLAVLHLLKMMLVETGLPRIAFTQTRDGDRSVCTQNVTLAGFVKEEAGWDIAWQSMPG